MRDCPNAKMRDLLPDLLHDRLTSDAHADVRAHVDACDACRAELELLRRVRGAVPEHRLDVSRIASMLPAYRARPVWRRALDSTGLRVAAAIVLLVGGAAIVTTLVKGRHDFAVGESRNRPPSAVVTAPEIPPIVGATADVAPIERTVAMPGGLATGETLHDLSDTELRALLDELGELDAVTPTEDDVVVPSIGRGSE